MPGRSQYLIGLALLAAACGSTDSGSVVAEDPGGLGDPLAPQAGNPGYDAVRYLWDFEVDPVSGTLKARAVMEAVGTENASVLSVDFAGPTPSRVAVDGETVDFEHLPPKLWTTHPLKPEQDFAIEVTFQGKPSPHTPTGFSEPLGWIHQGDSVYSSAVLPGDTATWAPLNDTPLDPALFSLSLTAPTGFRAVASGTPVEVDGVARWETTLPVTEFGFAVGALEQRSIPNADPTITFSAPKGGLPPSEWDQLLPDQIAFLEEYLGPFPFPTLGVVRVSGLPGGNSTPGQIFLGGYGEELLAHELAHQWVGGAVGTASSRDTWLREGIPEYLAYAWSAHQNQTRLEDRMQTIHAVLGDQTRSLLDVDEPSDRGDDATYYRGALAFHALHRAMGDDDFRTGLQSFTSAHAGLSVATDDFLEEMQRHSDIVIEDVLAPWIRQEKMPPAP